MAIQFSDDVVHGFLDAIETAIGTSVTVELRTGSAPANCAAADSGTLLCTITLPADYFAAASGREKAKAGTWSANATAPGTVGHFRFKVGSACKIQGPVTEGASEVDGELVLINTDLTAGQPVTVTAFKLVGPVA